MPILFDHPTETSDPDDQWLPIAELAKRRSGESGLAMGLASITSPQSESRFAASESLPIPSGRKML